MNSYNLPPQALAAEQYVLGAIILNGDALTKIKDTIRPDDFYRNAHALIYSAMLAVNANSEPIDIITLSDALKTEGNLKKAGDLVYLSTLANTVLSGANVQHHAKIVKEASNKRKILKMQTLIQQEIEALSVSEILDKIRQTTTSIVTGYGGQIVSMREIAIEIDKYIERKTSNPTNELSGIPSGFIDIDEMLDGFQGGQVYVIAGRPGTGKSALSMAIAQNAGVPVGRIDLEMTSRQIGIRALSHTAKLDINKVRKGYIAKAEYQSVIKAIGTMADLPIYFSFASYNVSEAEKIVTQMVTTKGIKMLIVDYLQLVNSSERKQREQEVAEVSRLMKRLAKTFNIPVLVLAALNRVSEGRENKKPLLIDLRESGQIEQDADVVLFLYQNDKSEDTLSISIAKGRNEGTGKVMLYFDKKTMTFKNHINLTTED